jgi:hypothetical protein
VDARHKAGHDGGEAVRFTRHGQACPGPKLMVSRGSSTVMAGLVTGSRASPTCACRPA